MATGSAASLAISLEAAGWAEAREFLPRPLVDGLRARITELDASGGLRPAAIGVGSARAVRPQIRGDRLAWIDGVTAVERDLLARLDELRLGLNRELQLGLHDLECHYAAYPPGARYARHLDRSPRGAERTISAVLYLNDAWQDGEGGELVLYLAQGEARIAPRAGTLALFLSQQVEHEVLPATRERLSVVGWYRRARHVPA